MLTPTEVSFSSAGSLDQLLESQHPALYETHAGGHLLPLRPMLFPVDHFEVNADHNAGSHYTSIGLACFRDALVYEGMFISDGKSVFRSRLLQPSYINFWITQGRFGATSFDFHSKHSRRVEGPVFVVSHANHVYGHWLLECVPKLLYLKHMQRDLPPIRILLGGFPVFAAAWVHYILPDAEVLTFDPAKEYVSCEQLLLPTMMCTPDYDFHLLLGQLVDELVGETAEPVEQIFLTRESPSSYRYMENIEQIKEIALSCGLVPVSPETLPIEHQIALFARCRLVVGDFGSALHNAIFSGPEAKVVGLNFVNCLQSRIARLRRHRIGFILPTSGTPLLYREGAPLRGYSIDPDEFRRCLDLARFT